MTPSHLSIILTDDDPHFLVFLKHVLTNLKIPSEIVPLKYGDELIQFLSKEKKHFDGILLDMNMPRKNGIEVLGEMRQKNLRPEIPIIVISQVTSPAASAEVIHLGAAAYMEKPCGLEEFKIFALQMIEHFKKK